ncbi:MAG: ribosome biogenesis GTP-binding protein YihA/YsxC [Candidatus Kapaibacteriales bacterium]
MRDQKELRAELIASAEKIDQFPKLNLPEIAFSGRSNVGKSSLINTLILRKNVAYTSQKPGKTRQINFYLIENKFVFADLPGFGYAEVSKELRQRWQELIQTYFQLRTNLKLVCLLVDSRLEPQKIDLAVVEQLEHIGRNFVLILTKSDKVNNDILNKRIKQFEFILQYCNFVVDIIPFSSVTKLGRDNVFAVIKKFSLAKSGDS